YQKLMELDDVQVVFDDEALKEVARVSLKRKTGARGLRAIMEDVMLDVMYEAPSDETLKVCRITKEAVDGTDSPLLEHIEADSESA
ncbi:MAG TPA: ATP-dependent Clp protease ATP-binding subunit ClpX, partial [Candidatus Dorea intestinavium]|nr:ATP-dependent Clp protease ATP-binding subunit ClpX [Candidatus Dorea intestinavium]